MRATTAMLLSTAILLAAPAARAAVTLPYLIADRMVVQRRLPVHIWGAAEPGETVTVAFRGNEQRSTADALGRWSVHLPPGEAGGPFEMTIRGVRRPVPGHLGRDPGTPVAVPGTEPGG